LLFLITLVTYITVPDMRKIYCLLFCCIAVSSFGQELKGINWNPKNKLEIESITTKEGVQVQSLPFFSLEVNRQQFNSNDKRFIETVLNKSLAIDLVSDNSFKDGIK
jgi:hypothetical protein